ncbi:ATP-dependent helicase [Mycoplasma phocoenae]|uniref:DNA 3'-5' helicase n=1 Tax=Mycoplasma phocoenae TaxID=754517 RepID=A0A858U647_9MOLU|nr:UvrD-helicase domain-containing protein [Mycoplasma phocoenae]QJG66735.1 UvrD-helicase domain-containing protein [Mycoplasma phocoenae]
MEEELKFSIDSLNEQQKQAVLYTEGPLRLIAGAGSGKTRVLTHKLAYLINEKKITPAKVLAVTFTNKAAAEMSDRALRKLDPSSPTPLITTFHSLCARILRREIHHLGFRRDFIILDELDQKQALKAIYQKLDINSSEYSMSSILSFINDEKSHLRTPEETLKNNLNSDDKRPIIYSEYQAYLTKNQILDYTDLLVYVRKIFYDDKLENIRTKWENMYEYILVDEFQDTSHIQYDIVKVLAKHGNITIVGDPDQTIYSWRNADVDIIINFVNDFPNVKTIKLEQNYRSTKKIIESANRLISFNKMRVEKKLFTENEEGENVEFYCGHSDEAEARWIAKKISDLKRQRVQLRNIAILYRVNSYSRAIEEALLNENTNHEVFGSFRFYQREEIKDAIAYLRVIFDGADMPLQRIINKPSRRIGQETLLKLTKFAEERNMGLWDAMETHFKHLQSIEGINRPTLERIADLINGIRWARRKLQTTAISQVLNELIINKFKYFESLKLSEAEIETKYENFKALITAIENWEKKNKSSGLGDYLHDIALLTEQNHDSKVASYVSLMSVHTAKGLEFDYVFVAGLSENVFPHFKALTPPGEKPNFFAHNIDPSKQDPKLIEEERRIAYVAFTRAKKKLFLSFSAERQDKQSRFIQEAGIRGTGRIIGIANTFSIAESVEKDNFKINDKIVHAKFGEGVVQSIDDDVMTIKFLIDGSERTFSRTQSPIKLVQRDNE